MPTYSHLRASAIYPTSDIGIVSSSTGYIKFLITN